MNILHAVTSINLGGAENHLLSLVKEQLKNGHTVEIVYLKGNGHFAAQYESLKVRVSCLEIGNYFFLYRSLSLLKICDRFNPDVIHAHMPPAELAVVLTKIFFKKIRKIPLVITKHNDEPFAPIIGDFFLLKSCLAFADRVICISDAVKKYHQFNIPKAQVVYYGIDAIEIQKCAVSDLALSKEKFIIGTVARLTYQKSLGTLLEAFALFQKNFSESLLVVVGVGELEIALKKKSKKLGIEDSVIWLGKRSDALGIMKQFNLFVLPSLYEGLGLVILEALALKIPIIASRVSALPDILHNGKYGLLFEAKNVPELFQKICQVKEGRFTINESESITMLQEKFSLTKMAIKTEQVYLEAMASRQDSVS